MTTEQNKRPLPGDRPGLIIDPELQGRRFLALGLMIVFVACAGMLAGFMIMISLSEPEMPPASESLKKLESLLVINPANNELKEALRDEDLRLRKEFALTRHRMKTGAYLLAAVLIGAAASGKWYAALDPKGPSVKSPAVRMNEETWRKGKRIRMGALVVMSGILFFAAVFAAFTRGDPGGVTKDSDVEPALSENAQDIKPALKIPGEGGNFKDNWPGFRGVTGMGIVKGGDWPVEWDAKTGKNILWKTLIPVEGNSSPVIWGNRIFVTGADKNRQEVCCYDRATGIQLWRTVVPPGKRTWKVSGEEEENEFRKMTGNAAPTPATDGKRLFVTYASADIAALDFNGKVLWVKNMGEPKSSYGLASSLLFHKGAIIFQLDRGYSTDDKLSALYWLNPEDGSVIGAEKRAVSASWSTPVIVDTDAGPELITCANPLIISYDPEYRTELWRYDGLSGDVAASPIYKDGLIYVTVDGAQALAIKSGGNGELEEEDIAWTGYDGLSDASSPVCDGKYFLQANGLGLVTCIDAKSGKLVWDKEFKNAFRASPALVGDAVYLTDEKGETFIFKLEKTYKLLSSGSLVEKVYASPAFCDLRIYFRSGKHLYCIGKGEPD